MNEPALRAALDKMIQATGDLDSVIARFRNDVVNLYLQPLLDAKRALDAAPLPGAPPGPKV
jgi:hypothetical protein